MQSYKKMVVSANFYQFYSHFFQFIRITEEKQKRVSSPHRTCYNPIPLLLSGPGGVLGELVV